MKTTAIKNISSAAAGAPAPRLLPLDEFRARIGGVSRATLYRWEKNGLIKLRRIGGRVLASEAEVARLAGDAA